MLKQNISTLEYVHIFHERCVILSFVLVLSQPVPADVFCHCSTEGHYHRTILEIV